MYHNNLPDDCVSRTDKSLPWNIDECKECGSEVVPNEEGVCEECGGVL